MSNYDFWLSIKKQIEDLWDDGHLKPWHHEELRRVIEKGYADKELDYRKTAHVVNLLAEGRK